MADVNANIGINFDTSQALAQLRQLQAGLSRFNQTLTQGNVAAMNAQKGLNSQLMQAINATGKFVATQKEVATSTSSFTQALEKNQLSMRQYFRYTAAAATQNTKVFKGMFAQERETLTRASKDRVKLLQSQYIQMQAANGDMIKVLQVIPKHLKMVNGQYTDYATRMQMAAQRQQFLNQLLKQGSTQLLNFGKNTQWAGRQLMVGLTIPLSILGSTAAKTFMEMEQAVLKFERVYGDLTTTGDATNKAIADIQRLGKEFTKYGIAVKDTVEMAATAAAMGLTGGALNSQVIAATRLAVLGQVEQQQALETTISLQNAFGISSDELAQKINFLNAVENQTVLSIEDLTVAIPKAGPVVKQLGGSVEDLAFFMTAMKEGGINASEGANALKSGLASMINPAKKTSEFLAGLGINIKGIVDSNAGNLKGTVVGLARALDTLDPLNRARAIEQLFGKFQFARLSTLFQNVTKDSSQAARALGLAGASVEELAILSERELAKVEDSTGAKFKKAMENLKNELVPVGKAFLQAVTPIVAFVGRILEKFNGLSDGTKKVITVMIGVIGGLAPIALMTFGILANGVANLIKFFAMLRGGIAKLNGSNNVLGGGFDYLTNQQIENLAETNALHTSHNQLISTFNVEQASVNALAAAYGNAASQARALASSSPGLFNSVPGPAGAVAGLPPKKFATGGVVPGTGNKDTVPALLTPGEVVITKQTAKENPELLAALQNGSVMKYSKGTGKKRNIVTPHTGRVSGGQVETRLFSGAAIMGPGNQATGPVEGSTLAGMDSRFIGGADGATAEFKAAQAAALKTQMMQIDGITKFNEKTYREYTDNWTGIDDALDGIADIFANGIGPDVSDVSELGQRQFPLIMAHIDELERSMKINAEQANTLREATRKLYNPDLGTPENPGRDAVAKNRQRIETGIDDAGNEVVTRVGVERVALPGKVGSDYLDARTKANTAREYARRGITPPDGKITFAHIKSGEKGTDFETPIASAKDGISEAEKRIVDTLTSGGKIKEGTVLITKQIAQSVEEGLSEAEKTAEVASPSKRTERLGKDIGRGLEDGLEGSIPGVRAQSDRLAEASIPRTTAETKAKVDKMDLDNKSFYDDIDTPEFRDQRQILKSQDRQRRKREKELKDSASEQGDGLKRVVESTDDTAESNLLVAEQTDELANATEDALDAQTQNATNILTGSQITDATTVNLNDVLQATDQTGFAQQDLAESSKNIAKTNELIEIEKKKELDRLKRYNAEQAAAQAAENGIIPDGAQSQNTMINPATAMGSVEAYEEASTYTRDKKGQILLDPETGQPTTLTKSQLTKKKRGMRKEKVGRVSGKLSGGLGTAAMVAGMAGAPPQVTAALGGAATVAQFAPMLAGMGPVGWAAAGIMAVGAGAYMLNQHFNKMAAESAKFVIATSATRESMKKMGELTGKVGASQVMDRRRQGSQYTKYNESYKVPDKFGKKFMSSDLGKSTKKTFKENTKKFGNQQAADDLGLKLAAQIADGVLSGEQAESISQALALSLKDQKVQMQVTGRIRTLLGPNGENLEKEPLETRLNLIANARARSTKTLSNIEKDGNAGRSQRKDIAALSALNMNNLELTTMMSDQLELHYETQKKKLEAELAATTNAQKRLDLEKQIAKITAESKTSTQTMNNQIGTQIALGQRDFNKFYSGSVLGKQAGREDAFFDGQSASVKAAYAGTDQAKSADKFLKQTKQFEAGATSATTLVNGQYVTNGLQSGKAAQQFQAKLQMLVGSKVLSPDEAMSYTKMFAGKLGQLNQLLTLSLVERGSAKTKELFNMFAGFKSKATATKLVKYMVQLEKGPQFDQNMETLKNLQALDGLTIDMELVLKGGPAVLEEIQRRQDLLEKLKEETEAEDKKSKKTTSADDFLEKAKKATPEDLQAIESLQKNTKKMAEFRKLSRDEQTEYLQKLAVGYTYEKSLNDEQIKADAELFIEKQMITNKDYRLLQDGTQAYKDARAKLLADYMSQTAGDRAQTNLDIGVVKGIDTVVPPGDDLGVDKKERDTTYDELNRRLRNVRNSAIDAAGGFKELQRAIAATGSKSIGNKFKGLEQQLLQMGQTSQFTDYLASLDTKDLKKFAYTATAADVKKKKGKQKYQQVDPETGKMVTKYQKFKAGDTVLTQKGRDMEQGYKKAIIGDYNKAQLQSVKLAQQEIAARRKLLALGYDELDIQTMLADENYKTLIATGKVTDAELKTNAALTKQARIRNQINGAVAGQKDLQKTTDNQKRIPEVVRMMQQGGMSAEAIRSAISDPAMLDTLINGMDNFATLAKDAQDEFNHLLSQINDIPERKIVEIVFTQTREEKIINASKAAAEMFDAYKMIDENTLTNKEGNTFAGLQVKIEDLNNQAKIAQNAINLTQSKIDDLQKDVDKDQRAIETNFTRPIEQKQREIEKLTRSAELNFTRPMQELQERSSVLSHDLDVMNKAAEAINEKYDKQQEALSKVAEINQQIIQQQQQQIGLADALSSGDISAAAKAVQEMRSTNAANYSTNAQDALQQARENEIGGLRGGVSKKSQKEIEAEQWDISQKLYDLELKKAAVDKEILKIQDAIYALEQNKQIALDAIQVKTDAIAKITFGTLLDQQNDLKAIQDKILPLQAQSDLLAAQIIANDRNRVIQGQTRQQWDLTLKAAEAAEKLAKGDLALALANINSVSGEVKGAWDDIKASYDAIKDKSVTITQHIITTYGTALGLPDPNAGKKPTPEETAALDKAIKGKDDGLSSSLGFDLGDRSDYLLLDGDKGKTAAQQAAADAQAKADAVKARQNNWVWERDASGGLIKPRRFAIGGPVIGTDIIPAMLTPGEFVMSKYAVQSTGVEKMKAINNGSSVGDAVYNYNLSVNVKSDASPEDIARVVMTQIKGVDAQRLRGNRF